MFSHADTYALPVAGNERGRSRERNRGNSQHRGTSDFTQSLQIKGAQGQKERPPCCTMIVDKFAHGHVIYGLTCCIRGQRRYVYYRCQKVETVCVQ